MKLYFLGANRQVTGSRYCLEAAGVKLLIDCGLFQERPYQDRNWNPNLIPAANLDAMVLTHAHIDHSGLIPRLVRSGFNAPIHTTRATADLAEVVLRDSAHIQEEDAAFKRRRHEKEGRRGKHPEKPLYTEADAEKTIPLLRRSPYGKPVEIADVFTVTFHDAGHILGSAMVEIVAREQGVTRRILFSGDVGQWDKPILRDPTLFDEADYVVMESTYGDRDHEDMGDAETRLSMVINDTVRRGGNLVIPVFAVERSQELMYHLSRLVNENRIPEVNIFLDSPMAVDVTEIFRENRDCFDKEAWDLIVSGEPPFSFPGLQLVRSVQESKDINAARGSSVIMSTSGMCTAGRIKHHLKHNIEGAENTVLFVGYQGRHTLGRRILDGETQVRIHGKNFRVLAEIAQLHGMSGHADRSGLLRWVGNLKSAPRRVFLTHGEEESSLALAAQIEEKLGWATLVPEYQEAVELD